jgi:hypothetical protein
MRVGGMAELAASDGRVWLVAAMGRLERHHEGKRW